MSKTVKSGGAGLVQSGVSVRSCQELFRCSGLFEVVQGEGCKGFRVSGTFKG